MPQVGRSRPGVIHPVLNGGLAAIAGPKQIPLGAYTQLPGNRGERVSTLEK